jgi:hypothetical protein
VLFFEEILGSYRDDVLLKEFSDALEVTYFC